ncbi:MAG: hypothetical protein HY900_05695, partial [Deltaproteobacteria bacterium]|nr:hypothetical protein [Deltaproteobacteria bacterium]
MRRLTLLMWGAVGWAMVTENLHREGTVPVPCLLSWAAAFLLCGLSFLLASSEGIHRWPRWAWVVILLAESGSVIFMTGWWRSLVGGFLLVFAAWQAARLLPFATSLAWVAVQSVLFGLILVSSDPSAPWLVVAVFCGGLQLFALLVAHLVRQEEEARVHLARSNSELRDAQELLGEASRGSERLRVARELHDGLGQKLVALNLALESAERDLARPADGLARARKLVHGSLAELRLAVGQLREMPGPDLETRLRDLVADIERPRIHLEFRGSCGRVDAARAQALLRCAQELLTNAIKHSGAANAWLLLECSHDGERLVVRDD